jgi:hypothetical protein
MTRFQLLGWDGKHAYTATTWTWQIGFLFQSRKLRGLPSRQAKLSSRLAIDANRASLLSG